MTWVLAQRSVREKQAIKVVEQKLSLTQMRSRPIYPLRIIECDVACWVEEVCVRDFVKEKFVDKGLEFRILI